MKSFLRTALILAALYACAHAVCSSNFKGDECGTAKHIPSVIRRGELTTLVNLEKFGGAAGCNTYSGVQIDVCEPGPGAPNIDISHDLKQAIITLTGPATEDIPFNVKLHCDC